MSTQATPRLCRTPHRAAGTEIPTDRHRAYRRGLCVDCSTAWRSAGHTRCQRCHNAHTRRGRHASVAGRARWTDRSGSVAAPPPALPGQDHSNTNGSPDNEASAMTETPDSHLPRCPRCMAHLHLDRGAEFSADRRYRHWLRRRWGTGPELMFVSLNPSDAGEHRDDATTRRDLQFGEDFGYDAALLMKLCAGVSRHPEQLAGMSGPRTACCRAPSPTSRPSSTAPARPTSSTSSSNPATTPTPPISATSKPSCPALRPWGHPGLAPSRSDATNHARHP